MKKFKIYFDKDKEEEWLNEMAQNGYAFTSFFLGMYSFEKCEPGEYSYQIDLLDNDTQKFLLFVPPYSGFTDSDSKA